MVAWIAPVIAAAQQEEEQQEVLAMLNGEDGGRYEYKIARSVLGFGRPDKLRARLDEEARAGWELAAKLDDSRLILRRPLTSREADQVLPPGTDAYRTNYGATRAVLFMVMLGLLIAGVLTLVLFALMS